MCAGGTDREEECGAGRSFREGEGLHGEGLQGEGLQEELQEEEGDAEC